MVKKKMYRKIKDLKKKGYGKIKIGKTLSLDPATVRKYFDMRMEEYTEYLESTMNRVKIFQEYEDEILEVYARNGNQQLNMSAVYDFLEECFGELPGSEKSLRNFIHHLERTGILIYKSKQRSYQKVPELPYGKQMQLDFGEYNLKNGKKVYIFAAVLSASRYKYIAFQDKPLKTLDVIFFLLDCFDYFGGIPEELVIDQDSLLVVAENYGEIIFTEKFAFFLEEMELKMYVCRKSDPESKGKIENVIKYVKYNFLQVRSFESLEEAGESLRRWLIRRANGKICQATKKVPALAVEEERPYLRPVKNSIFRKDRYVGRDSRTVSDKSFIMVGSNEYSVPVEYRKLTVEIYVTEEKLFVFDERTGREIAQHEKSLGTGERIRNKAHFRNNSLSVKELEKEIKTLFVFESWSDFVEKNHQTFPRYFRDQCILARDLFAENSVEESVLEMAVDYCLENKTYGMTALKDTYSYFQKDQKQNYQQMSAPAIKILKTQTPIEEPAVTQRAVGDYELLVAASLKRRSDR